MVLVSVALSGVRVFDTGSPEIAFVSSSKRNSKASFIFCVSALASARASWCCSLTSNTFSSAILSALDVLAEVERAEMSSPLGAPKPCYAV